MTAPTLTLVNSLTLIEHHILPSLNLVFTGTKFYSLTLQTCRFTILSQGLVPVQIRLSDGKITVSKKVSERKQATTWLRSSWHSLQLDIMGELEYNSSVNKLHDKGIKLYEE